MSGFYESTNNIDVLRERIEELSGIRERYACQLGSSLYEVTKDNDTLRWGREALYMGIADCDEERQRILDRISSLEFAMEFGKSDVETPKESLVEPAFAAIAETEPQVATSQEPSPFVPPLFEEEPQKSQAEPEPEPEVLQKPFDLEPDNLVVEPIPAPEPVVLEPVHEPVSQVVEPEPVFEPEPVVVEDKDVQTITCPVCGEVANAGDTFCMNCGSSLAQASTETAPKEEPSLAEPQEEEVVCPNCGSKASPGDKFCMECGATLHVAEPVEPEPVPNNNLCPSCGSPIDPSFKFCMTCGHKLI